MVFASVKEYASFPLPIAPLRVAQRTCCDTAHALDIALDVQDQVLSERGKNEAICTTVTSHFI